jgi:hypothetical protein
MKYRPSSYKDTPVIPTSERLPSASDGTVLAREHLGRHWWPTRWSDVTRRTHGEWRTLEYTDEHRARQKESDQATTAGRRAPKK